MVHTLATAQDDLDVAQSVISEVQVEANGPYADRLFNAVRALQGVIDDLEEGEDAAEGLLDAVRLARLVLRSPRLPVSLSVLQPEKPHSIMPETWRKHCPINEDEHPVRRQAWHAGWMYRMEHSARIKGEEARRIARSMLDDYKPSMLSIWMQGYNAADNYQRDELDG